MTKKASIIITGLAGEPFPLKEIRESFNDLTLGGTMIIQVPHRDMWFTGKPRIDDQNTCWYLPEDCEPPHTFSLAHVVRQALNAVCQEAPVNIETLSKETQEAYAEIGEGQGFWQFIDLRIEGTHIVAEIKKI